MARSRTFTTTSIAGAVLVSNRSWIIPGSLASKASSVSAPVDKPIPSGRLMPSAAHTPASASHVARTIIVVGPITCLLAKAPFDSKQARIDIEKLVLAIGTVFDFRQRIKKCATLDMDAALPHRLGARLATSCGGRSLKPAAVIASHSARTADYRKSSAGRSGP